VSLQTISFNGPIDFAHKVHAAFVRQGLSSSAAALLTAHAALSTGWGANCHNYSLAGIKAGPKSACYGSPSAATYSGSWFCACSWEFTSSGTQVPGCSDCPPKYGNPRCRYPFRAYASLDAGAKAMLGILSASRYATALSLLKAGSTGYFAEVGRAGWYTSNVTETANQMKANHAQVLKYLGMRPESGGGGGGLVLVVAGVGLAVLARRLGWI